MNRTFSKVTYANAMATVAVFLAIGGGAYALSAGSSPVKGGGRIVSASATVAASNSQSGFLKLKGIGKVSVGCGPTAASATWGFSTARHAAVLVTTGGSGVHPNSSGHISGHGHGFTEALNAAGSDFQEDQIVSQILSHGRQATLTLSVLNGGFPGTTGIGNACAFQAQVVEQP